MAKGKRSKVKMAYKAMRRAVMEPKHDAKLREQADKVYKAIGLPLPEERTKEQKMTPRFHGGLELVSTFVPTPKGPVLNVVHGPLAQMDELLRLPKQVVGFPIVGAGARARMKAEMPVPQKRMDMSMDDDDEQPANTPYFYPRRSRKSGSIRKKRNDNKRPRRMGRKKGMEVEASS